MPNFSRLREALFCHQPDRVPVLDLGHDREIKEAFLGKPILSVKEDVEFWTKAGYDCYVLMGELSAKFPQNLTVSEDSSGIKERQWAREGKGMITTWEEYENYPWPDAKDVDYSILDEIEKCLPSRMKAIYSADNIFALSWRLMGFQVFSYALVDNPELVERVIQRVGEIQIGVFKKVAEHRCIGAMNQRDDLAYANGLLVSPQFLRKNFFPFLEEMSFMCKRKGMPFIYHSDGNLWELLEDIIAVGVNALNPIEPKAMDIEEVKARTKGRLCLVGNIDLHYTLTRGSVQEVEEQVKERIRRIAPGGGYCLGAGAGGFTSYCKVENFKAMIRAALQYGKYPIQFP